jgi:hypothetical protein
VRRSIDSELTGASRPSSSGECSKRPSTSNSFNDDVSLNQIPEISLRPGSPSFKGKQPPQSNYLLRLKKQTQKINRTDTNDLVDNINSIKQRNQVNERRNERRGQEFERSCSPLLQSEDNFIEVKKCESTSGSKYILKGTRSTLSISSQCSSQASSYIGPGPTSPRVHKIIETSEDEEVLTPAEILIRNKKKKIPRKYQTCP